MGQDLADTPDYCVIEAAMEVIGGKWKMSILNLLIPGPQRFSELRRAMPTITQRMLTRQLRELEGDGLVQRTVYPQVPPKVEYALTEVGSSLQPIAHQLESWGQWYRDQVASSRSPQTAETAAARRLTAEGPTRALGAGSSRKRC